MYRKILANDICKVCNTSDLMDKLYIYYNIEFVPFNRITETL